MNDHSPEVNSLRARWHSLNDVDRAEAILPIIQSGVSRRKLADLLNCRESHIRRLISCLDADPEDLELARHLQISTNELGRRAKQARERRELTRVAASEHDRSRRVSLGTQAILGWLAEDPATIGNAEQILDEACFQLKLAEQTGGLPTRPAPIGMAFKEIIRRTRPANRSDEEIDVAWYAGWLAHWSAFAFPEWAVRWGALERALSTVSYPYWTANV